MMITWLNWISVLLYGTILTLSFLKIKPSHKNILAATLLSICCICIQTILVSTWGFDAVNKIYPFIVHLPLCLLCIFFYKKSPAPVIFALLAAYLLTVPRNWLGLMFAAPFPNCTYALDLSKLLVTLPLLFILLRFWTPRTRGFLSQEVRVLWVQMIPFLLYYVIAYVTTVYTQVLFQTNLLVLTFIMTMFTLIFFALSSIIANQNEQVMTLRQKQELLVLQSQETKLRLEQIRRSNQEVRVIRHDTRHYFQMLDSYAAAGNLPAIRDYIHQLDDKIDETMVEQYCLNDQVNLVLSSGIRKAKDMNIDMSYHVDIPETLESNRNLDLCILLANALENATNAALKSEHPWIELHIGCVGKKIVIQTKNSYTGSILFENGYPTSHHDGHGFGSQSILILAEKYGGTAEFTCEDDTFILNAVI